MALVSAAVVPASRWKQRSHRNRRQRLLLHGHEDSLDRTPRANPVRSGSARASAGPYPFAFLLSLAVHAGLVGLLSIPAAERPVTGPARDLLWLREIEAPTAESAAEPAGELAIRVPPPAAPVPPRERATAARPAPSPSAAPREAPAPPESRRVAEAPPSPGGAAETLDPPAPTAVASHSSGLARGATASIDELRILRKSMPRYPRRARLRGAEGVTVLRVLVERSGRVGSVEIDRSAGDEDLDRAAVRAIRHWRFAPGGPLREAPRLWVLIPVEFRLR